MLFLTGRVSLYNFALESENKRKKTHGPSKTQPKFFINTQDKNEHAPSIDPLVVKVFPLFVVVDVTKLTSQHEVQSSKHYTNGVLGAASPPRSLAAPCISADS